ncbi:hypothetical protein J2X63_000543 [Agromyces sp. 3263]|uniref:hypothetical protein n=1 Tax=Agromyces sp. 3263 TaxID=2817750 RepID=UPI00285B0C4A|nr:hypothetical protein [Agromyces sp. 3263]MDR6904857.1 hypothetical protein [Agromyces sp. 3263]
MRRLLDLRIVRWELKTLYIVVAWIVGFVVADLLRSIGTSAVVVEVANALTTFVPFALAVRIFRGSDEPVEPPRAWWRMTAWPALSRRLGILFAVLTVFGVLGLVLAAAGVDAYQAMGDGGATIFVSSALQFAVLAFLYLNSAVRMKHLGITKPRPLRLKPTMKL